MPRSTRKTENTISISPPKVKDLSQDKWNRQLFEKFKRFVELSAAEVNAIQVQDDGSFLITDAEILQFENTGLTLDGKTVIIDPTSGPEGANNKVAVDSLATSGFLGNSSVSGVLRTSTPMTYTDNGDSITLGITKGTGVNDGYIDADDWTIFNNKAAYSFGANNFTGTTGSFTTVDGDITTVTGDFTASTGDVVSISGDITASLGTVSGATIIGANVTSGVDPGHTHGANSLPDHNNLNGLNVGDYQHLTSAEKTDFDTLTDGSNADLLHVHSHGNLEDLLVDDHSQYLLLEGRDGQTIIDDIIIDGNLIINNTLNPSTEPLALSIFNGDLDLNNNFIENVGYVQFDINFEDGQEEGRLQWNIEDGTLEYGLPGGVVNLQIGQEMVQRVRNTTGSTILNGTPVYISGSSGQKLLITPANADFATGVGFRTIGVATEDILNNSDGYVTFIGLVRGLDLSSFIAGTPLYLAVNGGPAVEDYYTSSPPEAPNVTVLMGIVRKATPSGELSLALVTIPNLNSLSDVHPTNLADRDILKWVNAASRYENFTDPTIALNEPTGFINRTDTTLSFGDDPSTSDRLFTISPVGDDYSIWQQGVEYIISENKTFEIEDTSGYTYIFFDEGELTGILNPSHEQIDDVIVNRVLVTLVYWNTNTQEVVIFGDERHSTIMDGKTHEYLHDIEGARYQSGFTASDYILDIGADAALTFEVNDGRMYDEDIDIEVEDDGVGEDPYTQILNTSDAVIPVMYRDDVDSSWKQFPASTLPYITDIDVGVGVTGRLTYNNDDGDGTYSQVTLGNNKYMSYSLYCTNDRVNPIKMIQGQVSYNSKNDALEGVEDEITAFGEFPTTEHILLYRFVMQTSSAFGGTKNSKIVEVVDFRASTFVGSTAIPTDHGNLSGLSDDDHSQYLLLAGRGGQTIDDDLVLNGDLTMPTQDSIIDMSGNTPSVDTTPLIKFSDSTLPNGEFSGITKHTDGNTRLVISNSATKTAAILLGRTTVDTFSRWLIDRDGTMSWGPGNAAAVGNTCLEYDSGLGLKLSGLEDDLTVEGNIDSGGSIEAVVDVVAGQTLIGGDLEVDDISINEDRIVSDGVMHLIASSVIRIEPHNVGVDPSFYFASDEGHMFLLTTSDEFPSNLTIAPAGDLILDPTGGDIDCVDNDITTTGFVGVGTTATTNERINILMDTVDTLGLGISGTVSGDGHGLRVNVTLEPDGVVGTFGGAEYTVGVFDSATNDDITTLIGASANVRVNGGGTLEQRGYDGTVSSVWGLSTLINLRGSSEGRPDIGSAILFNGVSMDITTVGLNRVNSIETAIGLNLPDISLINSSVSNWAIASAGGNSHHVGNLRIGDSTVPEDKLEVVDGNISLLSDSSKLYLGENKDSSIYFDGTDLNIDLDNPSIGGVIKLNDDVDVLGSITAGEVFIDESGTITGKDLFILDSPVDEFQSFQIKKSGSIISQLSYDGDGTKAVALTNTAGGALIFNQQGAGALDFFQNSMTSHTAVNFWTGKAGGGAVIRMQIHSLLDEVITPIGNLDQTYKNHFVFYDNNRCGFGSTVFKAAADTDIYFDGTALQIDLSPSGAALQIGDGGDTDYTEITATGNINMFGASDKITAENELTLSDSVAGDWTIAELATGSGFGFWQRTGSNITTLIANDDVTVDNIITSTGGTLADDGRFGLVHNNGTTSLSTWLYEDVGNEYAWFGTTTSHDLILGADGASQLILDVAGDTTITGELTLGTDLSVVNGGTGASTFTENGVLLGDGTGPVAATSQGTNGQVLTANTGLAPTWEEATITFVGFSAYANSDTTGIDPGLLITEARRINFDAEDYDIDDNFDKDTTHFFTAPITGYYHFTTQVKWVFLADETTTILSIIKNPTVTDEIYTGGSLESTTISVCPYDGGFSNSASKDIQLNAGETVGVFVNHDEGGAETIDDDINITYFTGHLIGT